MTIVGTEKQSIFLEYATNGMALSVFLIRKRDRRCEHDYPWQYCQLLMKSLARGLTRIDPGNKAEERRTIKIYEVYGMGFYKPVLPINTEGNQRVWPSTQCPCLLTPQKFTYSENYFENKVIVKLLLSQTCLPAYNYSMTKINTYTRWPFPLALPVCYISKFPENKSRTSKYAYGSNLRVDMLLWWIWCCHSD